MDIFGKEPLQRTLKWYADRLGKVTGSRVADVVRKTKSGYSTSRENYLNELLIEKLTGQGIDYYTTSAMQHGIDTEPRARDFYIKLTGRHVSEVGFIDHPTIKGSGASPDGVVIDNGLLEIKCPEMKTHLNNLRTQNIDPDYIIQMQWQMACTGAEWCDFMSFDDRFPTSQSYFLKRVERDQVFIENLEKEVSEFIKVLDVEVLRLRNES